MVEPPPVLSSEPLLDRTQLTVRHLFRCSQIVACREVVACARKDYRPDTVVLARIPESVVQLFQQDAALSVAVPRPIENDPSNPPVLLVNDLFVVAGWHECAPALID